MKYALSFFLLICMYVSASSQQVMERVYDVSSGLLDQEVVWLWKDHKDKLWIGYSSLHAISSFDGMEWTHYDFADAGMPIGIAFYQIDDAGMWFENYNYDLKQLRLVLFDTSGKWKMWTFRGMLPHYKYMQSHEMLFLSMDHEIMVFKDSLFVNSGFSIPDAIGAYKVNFDGVSFMDEEHVALHTSHKISNDNKLFLYNLKTKKVIHAIAIQQQFSEVLYVAPFKFTFSTNSKIVTDLRNGKTTIIDDHENDNILNNAIMSLVGNSDEHNTISIVLKNANKKKDMYYYNPEKDRFELQYKDLNEGLTHRQVVLDRNNNIWYATQNGLIKRTPQVTTILENNSSMVNGLHTMAEDNHGRMWFGGYNNSGWVYWDGKTLHRPSDKSLHNNRVLVGATLVHNKLFFFDELKESKKLDYISNKVRKSIEFPEYIPVGFYFKPLKSGKIAAGLSNTKLLIFDDKTPPDYKIVNRKKGLLLDNILTISEDKNSRLWMGRPSQGVACYDPQKDTVINWLASPNEPEVLGVMASLIDQKGNLWLGTNKGVHVLKDPHMYDITRLNLISNWEYMPLPGEKIGMIRSMYEHDSYIIVGTTIGIYFIDKYRPPDTEGRLRVYVLYFDKDIPGKGAEQNALLVDHKGLLWVGTNEGALSIDIDNMRFDTSQTQLYLRSIKFGDSEIKDFKERITGPQDKRSLEIAWSADGNGYFQDNIIYSVAVITHLQDTIFYNNQTREKKISIAYLPPDTYKLVIKAYKNNQLKATLVKTIIIPKLLTEKIWFWVTLFVLIGSLPFIIILQYSKTKRIAAEKNLILEQSKRGQDMLRIKSLSNFFNPHFINNTLHWLQGRYKKDIETATVIDGLANNVSLLYQNIQSGTSCHSLHKELKIVDNYLDIQQVKYENKLQITKKININMDEYNPIVPSMIMQIHVENAVEKGIRNRAGAQHLSVIISQSELHYTIIIEDDGRGRSINQGQNEKRKGSTGIMHDLISIFNRYNDNNITVSYDDFIFDKKYGTRVRINIPKDYSYDLDQI